MSSQPPLDALEPRIQKMVAVLLRHRGAICGPAKGVLELHFNGRHVSANLRGSLTLEDETSGEPPSAA